MGIKNTLSWRETAREAEVHLNKKGDGMMVIP
jgi:hypothetical protein